MPRNLGAKINTARREQFPFFAKDGKLYFSSNGHPGYGSLDVFVSEIKDSEFTRPLNVGHPVNSGSDDFAFSIDSDTKEGYFSSNRKDGKGGDDIYSLTETKPLIIEDCMLNTKRRRVKKKKAKKKIERKKRTLANPLKISTAILL